jgi:predicted DNA-binding transcriptional regulator YafY
MSNLARIFSIDKTIREQGIITSKQLASLAREMEITDRQIRKDIEFMRYQLDAPIIYSRKQQGYLYETPFTMLTLADEKMLLTFSFLKSLLSTFNYVPYVTDEILKTVSEYLSFPYKTLSNKIIYELTQYETYDKNLLATVINSFISRKRCLIDYSGYDRKTSSRSVEPLTLINYSGSWYLVAFCDEVNSIRLFKMSRVESITLTDNEYRQKFSRKQIEEAINRGFGIYIDSGKNVEIKKVTVRFYGRAVTIMQNQTLHKDQQIEYGEDKVRGKWLSITLPVLSYQEILTTVLKSGVNAEVISPADFRKEWITTIKEMYKMYVK